MAQYIGLSFPFRKEGSEFPAESQDLELVRESLLQIVSTNRGERLMRPTFGINVLDYIFESNTDILASTIRSQVVDAITRFEDRIIVSDVQVQRNEEVVVISITYILRSTRQVDTVALSAPVPIGVS
jgi:phage baseplate assembly protein W